MVSRSRRVAACTRLILTLLTSAALLGAGEARGAQLTASWVDNSNGEATTRVERRPGTDTVFVAIADVPPGATTYVDASVSAGTSYCYRALAYDADGFSPYSDEACATSASTPLSVSVAKAGTGSGTVVSTPAGINCGTSCSATYLAGTSVTLTANPASGSTFNGWTGGGCTGTAPCTLAGNAQVAVTASFAKTTATTAPVTLSLIYNGKLRDRVGQGNAALGPDGAMDGTLTATLRANGGRTIKGLKLESTGPGTWDTDGGNGFWALGVASTLSRPLLNNPATMAVNFAVSDGGTFVVFAADSAGIEFLLGNTLTLKATFSDGTTATATTTVGGTAATKPGVAPTTLSVTYNGKLRDRVGQGNTALSPDGAMDGTLTATLHASGGRTITSLRLDSTGPGIWDTLTASAFWTLGVATALDAVPLLNDPGTMAVNFAVPDGGTFVVFAADSAGIEFVPGATLTLTAAFSDGTTATAVTSVQ